MGIGDARSPTKRWLYSAHEEYRKLAAGLSRAVVLKGKSIHLSGSIELSLFRGSKTPRWKIRVAFLPTWSGSAKAICTRISLLHGWPGLHLKFSIHINFPILFTSFISLSPFHQIWLNAQWLSSDLRSIHRSSIYKPFCRLDRLGKKNLNSSNPPDKSLADFAGAGPEKASNLLVVSFKILLYLSTYCCFLSLSVVSSANVIRSDQGERSYVNWNIYRISEKSAGGWQPNSAHVVPSSSPEIWIYSRVGPHLGLWNNGKGTKWTEWK